ncbi:MAG: hypothetical protein AB1941_30420 [Gemmatimonadota bacterium]
MSSRPLRTDETPAPGERRSAPPRAEQLIETHKAWIAAAAGVDTRHARRRPRFFRHLRPLAISAGIAAAALALVSLTRGGGESTGRPADLAGELIPTLGADAAGRAPAEPVARAFRGGRGGAEEGKRRGGNQAATRRQTETAREDRAPDERTADALREERVPEPSLALSSAPAAAPQVTDGRPAAEPEAAGARSGDTAPRTAAAVPAVQ